ncbi:PMT-domain-containing protein [Neocallimastix lanati (nom. inval.)]|jgi:dolichyl-phosphate-mannose-protein mannosyltransferase|uniref:Dolichyl-phosphate-mannose--protein mannosyltransferase n=1 Tax=Neocallimastix californiae TaxID=1754190 RepID=A0A1Y2D438_9FUNG|nr:PMT-domain-containing protein [Neocallimastix sp. JGI-2020a]ORY54020.1 PMT-domain-containing protein [Neocallimastix californiae]|eukprot:ORY54020.1 PMT-domain-containing protein [Neocallimastix californiae]
MENVIKRQAKSNSNKKNEDLLGNNSQYSETEPLISSEEKIHKKPFNFNNFIRDLNAGVYDSKLVLILVIFALCIRLPYIHNPRQVVFDEVHFGGFANKYISRKFFMDVHPPLAKLMITYISEVFMYNGSFPFKNIGDSIPSNVPYIQMRMLNALLGVALIPISFHTIKALGFSSITAFVTGILVTCENSLATQSRLILLDAPLLLFTGFTLLSWAKFQQYQKKPFTDEWWKWLTYTGIGLGLVSSVKWVGLFSVATIGLCTLNNLWNILGNLENSMKKFVKHFMARALCLIVIPVSIYAFFFLIHFLVLNKSGSGAAFMSPEFQTTFVNSTIPPSYLQVGYGSEVTIRHVNTNGGFLHSHGSNYKTGSKQQQITCYSHRDSNNIWIIEKIDNSTSLESFEPLRNGDVIRLLHRTTKRRLHSHGNEKFKPPVSQQDYQYEATGYGNPNVVDSNDHWKIDVIGAKKGDPVEAINSRFRLIHVNNKCSLFSHTVKLPNWAYSQQEVTCGKGVLKKNTIWVIENNENPLLDPNSKKITYNRPGFFKKFIELNTVMWNVNKDLTSSHPYESHPSSWLFLRRGISFWTGKKDYVGRIYLNGNPVSWYLGAISVLFYIGFFSVSHFIKQIHRKSTLFDTNSIYYSKGGYLFTAYFWHYFPFFVMGRQLFIHHYLPCVYITILLSTVTLETILKQKRNLKWIVPLILAVISFISFIIYSPFTYGIFMTTKHCNMMRLRKSWDWDCAYFDKNAYRLNK